MSATSDESGFWKLATVWKYLLHDENAVALFRPKNTASFPEFRAPSVKLCIIVDTNLVSCGILLLDRCRRLVQLVPQVLRVRLGNN